MNRDYGLTIAWIILAICMFGVFVYVIPEGTIDTFWIILLSIVTSFILTLAGERIYDYFDSQIQERLGRDVFEEEGRVEREIRRRVRQRRQPHFPEIRERRHSETPRLTLRDLQVMMENPTIGKKSRKVGRLVDPRKTSTIRPIATIEVYDRQLVDRILPVEFNFVQPDGEVVYRQSVLVTLKFGINRIAPLETITVDGRGQKGIWHNRLWARNREWGERTFTVSDVSLDALSADFGGDLEKEGSFASEQIAEEIAAAISMDELLEE